MRDVAIKSKKIDKLVEKLSGAQGSASDGDNNSIPRQSSVEGHAYFMPHLPFLKEGERISKFGVGFSKLLKKHSI